MGRLCSDKLTAWDCLESRYFSQVFPAGETFQAVCLLSYCQSPLSVARANISVEQDRELWRACHIQAEPGHDESSSARSLSSCLLCFPAPA